MKRFSFIAATLSILILSSCEKLFNDIEDGIRFKANDQQKEFTNSNPARECTNTYVDISTVNGVCIMSERSGNEYADIFLGTTEVKKQEYNLAMYPDPGQASVTMHLNGEDYYCTSGTLRIISTGKRIKGTFSGEALEFYSLFHPDHEAVFISVTDGEFNVEADL